VVDNPGDAQQAAGAWDEYWRLTREAAAHKGGGPQDEVLARFWTSFFKDALSRASSRRLLDLACGNGAVARFAFDAASVADRQTPSVVGVDNSLAALRELRERFPPVFAVAADAKRTPFADGLFDVVASQFGLEYAGIEAVDEAARLVARGGMLAAVLHLKGGAIYRECATNLQAIEGVRACEILPAVRNAFRAGVAASHGRGSKSDFRRAHARLAAAAKELEEILRVHGEGVAGGAVHRLHTDISHMYRRLDAYDATDVANWADGMAREIVAYASRMSSMVAAAIDDQGLDEIAKRVTSRGLSVRIREKLHMGVSRKEPAAWVFVSDRG
jgi:SAM-dependent methyltransferase